VTPEAQKLSTVTIRNYSTSDYPLVCELWAAQAWPAPGPAALPKTGKIAYLNGRIAAAAFLYRTDSTVGILEWVVADPKLSSEDRSTAVNEVLLTLTDEAANQGCKVLFHMTSHKRLIERFQSHGWSVTDVGQSHLIKVL
jgi:hypothetical protein